MNNGLDDVLAGLDQGIVLFDQELRVACANEQFGEMLALPSGVPERGTTAAALLEVAPILRASALNGDGGPVATDMDLVVADRTIHLVCQTRPQGGFLITTSDVTFIRAAEARLVEQNIRFDAALGNMPHGLCMFDAERRLLLSNAAYARLYALPEDLTRPGTPLQKILEHRISAGNSPAQMNTYFNVVIEAAMRGSSASQHIPLRDGRIIKISHQPLQHGGYVATHEDVTEAARAEEKIKFLAGHDPLTGLLNRSSFQDLCDDAVKLARIERPAALLCLDLDKFKTVNDTLGHAAGDNLLKALSDRIKDRLRSQDSFARLGGDEFAIFIPGGGQAEMSVFARRLVDAVRQSFSIEGKAVQIGVSIGIAIAPQDGDTLDTLMRHADKALYQAKHGGRSTFRFYGLTQPSVKSRRS
jgi:diguanylate cyclase (GGDEF)-like protein